MYVYTSKNFKKFFKKITDCSFKKIQKIKKLHDWF